MKEKAKYLNCDVDALNGIVTLLAHALTKRRVFSEFNLDDIESVREMLRVFYPKKIEHDYFDALIQEYRGYMSQSISTLRNLIEAKPNFPCIKAFLARALFEQRDVEWESIAAAVLDNPASTKNEITIIKIIHKQNELQKGILSQEEFLKQIQIIYSSMNESNASNMKISNDVQTQSQSLSVPNYAVRM